MLGGDLKKKNAALNTKKLKFLNWYSWVCIEKH